MKTLAHHILDIAENSINADAAFIEIEIEERPEEDRFTIVIKDNGAGIDPESLKKITDPWYTTRDTREIGMGLALLRQNAEMTGGSIQVNSQPGKGTIVKANFAFHHIDRPPLGDIAGTVTMLMAANPQQDFGYRHTTPEGTFATNSREIKEVLEDTPLNAVSIQKYIKEMIQENINTINSKA